ncbi:MAG: hypothetical protein L0L04_02630 [Staphylococcus equorum]|nr:hypothetical protein [Staphylococcus equorum]
MLTSDSLRKTPYDEWVNTPITVIGNQELVGGSTTEYLGRYKIYESKDGGLNYFLKYTSSSDESVVTYKPFDNDITHVKLQFYLAGSTLNLIDEQILPVIIDRNKAYTHTAYAYSADGTDRFTNVYPNLNLFKNTKSQSYTSTGTANNNSSNNYPLDGIIADILNKPLTITYNYAITNSSGTWSGMIRPTYGLGGTNQSVSNTNLSGTHKETVTLTNVGQNSYGILTSGLPTGIKVTITNLKVEFGSTATPWMPSQSESQAQWQDAIPMYVGVGEKDSQNPSDYRWVLNPRYIQASSDSGLSNKAGLDDLASIADTANDALVQAQNAVSNEDYTSWLEYDYQTTINNLQDVSTQNKEDIDNVNDRTTIVEGFYDRMKVKWNFINESFTFSEEGMFISNKQSKMAIQVTSDKIVFWDNNVDVAFITGEVLNIQKGVFLESATIGNHLITKFSNESPVTIIRYVGGIT